MIATLRGMLSDVALSGDQKDTAAEIVIEVQGVGYRTLVNATTIAQLGPIGTEVHLYIHTHVREDALLLYGFRTRDERSCFEVLLSAHGVGPSVALAILSIFSPTNLAEVVEQQNVGALCEVPGIGKKTAAKLLIELQSRLQVPTIDLTELAGQQNGDGNAVGKRDARAALVSLGYGADEVRLAMNGIDEATSAEEALREALQKLAVSQ